MLGVVGCFREAEPIRDYTLIYYEKFSHLIMETEKSMVCYQQVGDPGKQVVWFHTKSGGLRTMGADGVSPSPRAGKNECSSSTG